MSRAALLSTIGLLLVTSASAQAQGLKWEMNVEKGVALAKNTRRPIMFYIVGRSGDRQESTERSQKRAFRDKNVQSVARRFVPIKLSRSRHRDLLKKWNLPPRTNLEIVFATPGGDYIDRLAPSGIGHADSFAGKMVLVFRQYRQNLYEAEIKAKLLGEKADVKSRRVAMNMIKEFLIVSADRDVLELLKDAELPAALRKQAYGVLAELSTDKAVKELFKLAAKDALAATALNKCTPDAAEALLEHLGGEIFEDHLRAYRAVTKICKVKSVKPDRFWSGKIERVKTDEVARVRELVRRVARRWRERYAEYR